MRCKAVQCSVKYEGNMGNVALSDVKHVNCELLAKITLNVCKTQNVSVKSLVWLCEIPMPFENVRNI